MYACFTFVFITIVDKKHLVGFYKCNIMLFCCAHSYEMGQIPVLDGHWKQNVLFFFSVFVFSISCNDVLFCFLVYHYVKGMVPFIFEHKETFLIVFTSSLLVLLSRERLQISLLFWRRYLLKFSLKHCLPNSTYFIQEELIVVTSN